MVKGSARSTAQVASHRPQLPGRAHAQRLQDRHHAGNIFKAGKVGHRLAVGHASYEAVKQTTRRRSRPVDGR